MPRGHTSHTLTLHTNITHTHATHRAHAPQNKHHIYPTHTPHRAHTPPHTVKCHIHHTHTSHTNTTQTLHIPHTPTTHTPPTHPLERSHITHIPLCTPHNPKQVGIYPYQVLCTLFSILVYIPFHYIFLLIFFFQ